MNKLRILIVEDEEQDLSTCRDSVDRYIDEKNRDIELVECKTLDKAQEQLDNSFDGAIIDLTLGDEDDAGNQVIEEIRKSFFRIPIFIFTGRDTLNQSIKGIEVFTKDEFTYYDLLDKFCETYDTGFTRMMGGNGEIEELLGKVFLENLLLQRKKWVSYGKADLERTEKALLRYTLNHLLQLLEEGDERCFPEEVYLYPHVSKNITTGSIVKEKTSNQPFVVLSPACDLVIRKSDDFKTDRILLVEIEVENDIVNDALDGIKRKRSREDKLKAVSNNNHTDYYHWLPKTNFFKGGVLNFRKLKTVNKADFGAQFETPSIQISPFFVKDIVSRFASYYARQGQPDIDSKDFVARYTAQQGGGQ